MYEHVAVEHLQYSEHITDSMAQSALRKAVKQVRADQSATTHATRQIWRELACRREFTQLAALSNAWYDRIHRNLPVKKLQ